MFKKLFIKTYGCQMNVYDSIKMESLLKPHGFLLHGTAEGADMVILNTCHIREKASEKVYSELGRIRQYKENKERSGEKMLIVVAGCVAQAEGEEIIRRAPFVDIVVGPQAYHNLPELLADVQRKGSWAMDLDFHHEAKFDELFDEGEVAPASSLISVQEGCDKFCHFCVVPYTRGEEFSRNVDLIQKEARALVSAGALELTLLGQNVSAYHGLDSAGKEWGLGKLIQSLTNIPGLRRLRYLTSHPRDMTDPDLFLAHANEEKLMPFLHLPIQSGSDRILQLMNRKHSREFYLEIIDKFKEARSDMAFSSDFIVGYPGESDQDFLDTVDMVRKVGYAQCYSFKYSPRPGTPAAMLEDQVPEEVKYQRLQQLQKVILEMQLRFNRQQVGKVLPVLFDRLGRRSGQIAGKSPYMQTVLISGGEELLGLIVDVHITGALPNSLLGELYLGASTIPDFAYVSNA